MKVKRKLPKELYCRRELLKIKNEKNRKTYINIWEKVVKKDMAAKIKYPRRLIKGVAGGEGGKKIEKKIQIDGQEAENQ